MGGCEVVREERGCFGIFQANKGHGVAAQETVAGNETAGEDASAGVGEYRGLEVKKLRE